MAAPRRTTVLPSPAAGRAVVMDELERSQLRRHLAHPADGRDPADRDPVGYELLVEKRVLNVADARLEDAPMHVGGAPFDLIDQRGVLDVRILRQDAGDLVPVGTA